MAESAKFFFLCKRAATRLLGKNLDFSYEYINSVRPCGRKSARKFGNSIHRWQAASQGLRHLVSFISYVYTVYRIKYHGVDHAPLGRYAELDCSIADTERYVFGKVSAACLQRRSFWHRHYSKCCGDTEQGKSVQGVVIV